MLDKPYKLYYTLNRRDINMGRYSSDKECHAIAEELDLDNYCITFYTFENFKEKEFYTDCWGVESL